jgi:hypothetical protein
LPSIGNFSQHLDPPGATTMLARYSVAIGANRRYRCCPYLRAEGHAWRQ